MGTVEFGWGSGWEGGAGKTLVSLARGESREAAAVQGPSGCSSCCSGACGVAALGPSEQEAKGLVIPPPQPP